VFVGVAVLVGVGVRSSGCGGRGVTVGSMGDNGCCNNDFADFSTIGVAVGVSVGAGVGDAVGVGVMGIGDGSATCATSGGGGGASALAVRPFDHHKYGATTIPTSKTSDPSPITISRPDDNLLSRLRLDRASSAVIPSGTNSTAIRLKSGIPYAPND